MTRARTKLASCQLWTHGRFGRPVESALGVEDGIRCGHPSRCC